MGEKIKAVKFTNITEDVFTPVWDGAEWEIEPGETVMVESGIADTFVTNLLNIIANKEHDGIMPPDVKVKLTDKCLGKKVTKKDSAQLQSEQLAAKEEAEKKAAEEAEKQKKEDLKNSGKASDTVGKGKEAKEDEKVATKRKKEEEEAEEKEEKSKKIITGEEDAKEVFED